MTNTLSSPQSLQYKNDTRPGTHKLLLPPIGFHNLKRLQLVIGAISSRAMLAPL